MNAEGGKKFSCRVMQPKGVTSRLILQVKRRKKDDCKNYKRIKKVDDCL